MLKSSVRVSPCELQLPTPALSSTALLTYSLANQADLCAAHNLLAPDSDWLSPPDVTDHGYAGEEASMAESDLDTQYMTLMGPGVPVSLAYPCRSPRPCFLSFLPVLVLVRPLLLCVLFSPLPPLFLFLFFFLAVDLLRASFCLLCRLICLGSSFFFSSVGADVSVCGPLPCRVRSLLAIVPDVSLRTVDRFGCLSPPSPAVAQPF